MRTYKIERGDTPKSLSLKFFGDLEHASEIVNANLKFYDRNNDRLFAGETILIPATNEEKKDLQEKDLSIFINNKELEFFANVKLSDAFDCIANGLIFTIPNTKENRKTFVPFLFPTLECYFGSEKLITGVVFKVSVVNIHTLEVVGYNKAQHINTCNLSPNQYPRTFNKSSLKSICTKMLEPLSIKVSATKTAEELFNKVFENNSHIEYNETMGEFLLTLAQQRNLIIKPNATNGGLIFDKFTKDEIILDLVEEKIYQDFQINFNSEFLFKNLTGIRGRTHRQSELRASITNDFIIANRNFVKSMRSGEPETITEFIKNEDRKQKKQLFKININYPVLTDKKGKLIKSGGVIVLKNENYYIYKETKFLIISVDYDFNNRACKLECQPAEIFKGEQINEFWK